MDTKDTVKETGFLLVELIRVAIIELTYKVYEKKLHCRMSLDLSMRNDSCTQEPVNMGCSCATRRNDRALV